MTLWLTSSPNFLSYAFNQLFQDTDLSRNGWVVCTGHLIEETDCCKAISFLSCSVVVRVLGVPVEQLDFHRLLNPIQVMLRSLKAVFAPMPHSVVKFIPEVNGNVKKKDDKTIME